MAVDEKHQKRHKTLTLLTHKHIKQSFVMRKKLNEIFGEFCGEDFKKVICIRLSRSMGKTEMKF